MKPSRAQWVIAIHGVKGALNKMVVLVGGSALSGVGGVIE